jgi:hypothetical protein
MTYDHVLNFRLGFEYKEHNKRHTENGGWCRSLMMLLLALLLVTVGSGISLLFIYTGGHLDQQSIERALPVLQHDVEHTFVLIGKKVDFVWQEAHRILNPFWKKVKQLLVFLINGYPSLLEVHTRRKSKLLKMIILTFRLQRMDQVFGTS